MYEDNLLVKGKIIRKHEIEGKNYFIANFDKFKIPVKIVNIPKSHFDTKKPR